MLKRSFTIALRSVASVLLAGILGVAVLVAQLPRGHSTIAEDRQSSAEILAATSAPERGGGMSMPVTPPQDLLGHLAAVELAREREHIANEAVVEALELIQRKRIVAKIDLAGLMREIPRMQENTVRFTIEREEAERALKRFFTRNPAIEKWLKRYLDPLQWRGDD